jgi:hypothetical protein
MVEQELADLDRTQNGRKDLTRSRRPTTGNCTLTAGSILEMQRLSQTKRKLAPCGKPHIASVGIA